jgi:ribosomal protein S3AE
VSHNIYCRSVREWYQQNLKYIEQQLPEKIKQDMKDIYPIKSLGVINNRLAKIVDKLNEMINRATEDWLKENK